MLDLGEGAGEWKEYAFNVAVSLHFHVYSLLEKKGWTQLYMCKKRNFKGHFLLACVQTDSHTKELPLPTAVHWLVPHVLHL